MTNFQKAVCLCMSVCFLAVLLVLPSPFFLAGNVYRQLPLYCFLEEKEKQRIPKEDAATTEIIIAKNEAYLEKRAAEEQSRARKAQEEEQAEAEEKAEKEQAEVEEKAEEEAKVEAEEKAEEKAEAEAEEKAEEKAEAEAEDKAQEEAKAEEAKAEEEKKAEVEAEKKTEEELKAEAEAKSEQEAAAQTEENIGNQKAGGEQAAQTMAQAHPLVDLSLDSLSNFDYLLNQFFILDENTQTNEQQLNAVQFLEKDLTIQQDSSVPQILIYHSHSQETFADSREGEPEDTVVGVGDYLTQLLTETYGYQVLHVKETFDIVEGEIDRNRAYDFARDYIEQVLEENPTIEVVIDLHRDGVPEDRHLVTEINGKDTAQVMFYNGLSYTVSQGAVDYLPNPYIEDNLAFSFQLEYQAAEYYPDFYRGIYLAGLRYNLHLRQRALLLEAGAQTNTLQEVKNAMEPFADILNRVLKGGDK